MKLNHKINEFYIYHLSIYPSIYLSISIYVYIDIVMSCGENDHVSIGSFVILQARIIESTCRTKITVLPLGDELLWDCQHWKQPGLDQNVASMKWEKEKSRGVAVFRKGIDNDLKRQCLSRLLRGEGFTQPRGVGLFNLIKIL